LITLTSDFGLQDSYVAQMKGVILSINPKATLVDLSHSVEKFNIRHGAFMLASAVPFFPKGTVHLVVVDPGVGTERRAVVIQTKQAFFVGPDNGVLMLSAQNQGIAHIYQIMDPKFILPQVSNTFHGRDVFAPVSAYLDNGITPTAFGPELNDVAEPKFATVKCKANSFIGEILHVDGFGNIVSNITPHNDSLAKSVKVKLSNQKFNLPFCKTYGQAKLKQAIALFGSHGFLEIALNQGSAAEKFCAKVGDTVEVEFKV
jgi:S-adenosyl-L-methionine hydrolase (adenosine-forming)